MVTQVSLHEELAREIERTPKEYLPDLLQIVRVFRESVALKPADTSFRQGWTETLSRETRPISELWEDIDEQHG